MRTIHRRRMFVDFPSIGSNSRLGKGLGRASATQQAFSPPADVATAYAIVSWLLARSRRRCFHFLRFRIAPSASSCCSDARLSGGRDSFLGIQDDTGANQAMIHASPRWTIKSCTPRFRRRSEWSHEAEWRQLPDEQLLRRLYEGLFLPVFANESRPAPIGSFSGRKSRSLD